MGLHGDQHKLGLENDSMLEATLNPTNELKLKLGLENDSTLEATLNPTNELKLKLGLENVSTMKATLNPTNELKLKLGLENVSMLEATLNPTNKNRLKLKLKQDDFEQGRVLERIAQIPLVKAGTYDMYDSVSHGTNKNSDARLHNRNSASANNSSDGGFRVCI